MTSTRHLVPLDGTLLFAECIDFNVQHNPDLPFWTFSRDDSPDEPSFITHSSFARAAQRVARYVDAHLPSSGSKVVAVIAMVDTLVYHALVTGLILAGRIPFPISPRNSPAAIVNLLEKTSCGSMITTRATLKPLLDGVELLMSEAKSELGLQIHEAPPLCEVYPQIFGAPDEGDVNTWLKTLTRPHPTDLCIYVHSSGSTGFPKAIPWTHRTVIQWASLLDHYRRKPTTIAVMPLPAFHTLGLVTQVLYPLFAGLTAALYPPRVFTPDQVPIVPSPENVIDHTKRTKSDSTITVPAFLQAWIQSPSAIDILKNLNYVYYSGGALPRKVGNRLCELGVELRCIYGGTEFGPITNFFPTNYDHYDWEWMALNSDVPLEWDPQGADDFECRILAASNYSPAVLNMEGSAGYATSDVFVRHPTKSHLWRIIGRVDDVIIHSSGEKTVPAPMEGVILSSPYVEGVVLCGRARDYVAALIEPNETHSVDVSNPTNVESFIDEIWPIIEEANQGAPGFSRIYRHMIAIVSREKPLPRAGKGTVMRKAALELYAEEIQQLYDAADSTFKSTKSSNRPKEWTRHAVMPWLEAQLRDIHPERKFAVDADLFEQGFDSLGATFLRQRMVAAFRSVDDEAFRQAAEKITDNTVYHSPKLPLLADYIVSLLDNPFDGDDADPCTAIEAMISKYSDGFSSAVIHRPARPDVVSVLLTGSTGSLGSQLLAKLLADDKVHRVYALNRPSSQSALDRHQSRFNDQGLDIDLLLSTKVVFLEGDAAQLNLGLGRSHYEELVGSVDVIVHNAWKLDFNQGLASFESNVRGTRNLIDLALESSRSPRFIFTGSIAQAQSWDQSKGSFPETVVEDPSFAVGGGYGESKYVAERVLVNSGLEATSLRIGQLTGSRASAHGAWATSDWLPILVKSSVALGVLPHASGVVSWLPIDAVASLICDLAFTRDQLPPVLNALHPRPIQWNDALESVNESLVEEGVVSQQLEHVPFNAWVDLLEKRKADMTEEDIKRMPAVKLLSFYRQLAVDVSEEAESGGLARFALEASQAISDSIRQLEPLGKEDASRWVKYWKS